MIENKNFGRESEFAGKFEVTVNDGDTTCYRMVTEEKNVYSASLSVGDKSFSGSGESCDGAFENLYAVLSAYLDWKEFRSHEKKLCIICKDTKLMFFYDIDTEKGEDEFALWYDTAERKGWACPDELLLVLSLSTVFSLAEKGEIPYETWRKKVEEMPLVLQEDLVHYMYEHHGLPRVNDVKKIITSLNSGFREVKD